MKRFLLIAAGTVGGLGAVLSITPPQLGSTDLGLGLDMGTLPTSGVSTQTPVASQTTPPAVATSVPAKPNQSATKPNSTKPSVSNPTASTQTQTSAPTPAQTPATTPATPTPVKTAATTPTVNSVNGTFTGPVVNVSYGNVQVQITVTNGKITDAQALIAPTGKNDKYTRMALPQLKQQTLAAQSTTIQGASGASYTTYGWRKSLQGAMVKAGL
jgi:uncharacterized protein with FMN-binding domain